MSESPVLIYRSLHSFIPYFKTAKAKQYPAQMCRWLAAAFVEAIPRLLKEDVSLPSEEAQQAVAEYDLGELEKLIFYWFPAGYFQVLLRRT